MHGSGPEVERISQLSLHVGELGHKFLPELCVAAGRYVDKRIGSGGVGCSSMFRSRRGVAQCDLRAIDHCTGGLVSTAGALTVNRCLMRDLTPYEVHRRCSLDGYAEPGRLLRRDCRCLRDSRDLGNAGAGKVEQHR